MLNTVLIKDSYDDNSLVLRAKAGDSVALSMLIERYSDKLLQKAKSYKNLNGLESDDLYQEGMLGFVSSVYSFDENRGVLFNTYASTVSERRMLTALRKSNNIVNRPLSSYISLDESVDVLSNSPSPEEMIIFNEEVSEIINFSEENFSKTERKVFKLILLGVSYSEIADILDCSIKSVDNAVQRIRRKIRTYKSE